MGLVWHPQQGLYNWRLLAALRRHLPRPAYRAAQVSIIGLDTAGLAGRALARRASAGRAVRGRPTVLHIDLGTHREAAELCYMVDSVLPRVGLPFRAVGFEADPESYAQACRAVSGRPIELVHAAVVRDVPEGGTVRLYSSGQGLGNSLYREEFTDSHDVPAVRLSQWLAKSGIDLDTCVCLLRMNIEGAEADVIADLDRAGLLPDRRLLGMWDDVSKTGHGLDELTATLSAHRIRPFTFNGRDLAIPLRMRAIDTALRAAVVRGSRRVASHPAAPVETARTP